MTMDEACLILNVKKDSPMEQVLKVSFKGTIGTEPDTEYSFNRTTNTYSRSTLRQKHRKRRKATPHKHEAPAPSNQNLSIRTTSSPRCIVHWNV